MTRRSRITITFGLALFSSLAISNLNLQADDGEEILKRGRSIYAQQCASCHGTEGQGTKDHYEDPLEGDLVVSELAELISETMPEEDPDSCVAKDAEAVASFVFHEFYSADAQYRRNAPRIQLSRRTVRQYRQSVADLIASFSDPLWIPDERGIEGHYFAASHWNERRRLAKQVDANIDFANGVQHFRPDGKYEGVEEIKKENKMGDGFSIFWFGGIIAPQSGEYEFTVECRNGFKLYINDVHNPAIDQWVRSNDDLVHSTKIQLLGGRPYSFKLDMFQYEDPTVQVRVLWKLPNGTTEVIPKSAFLNIAYAEGLAIKTVFPADDASEGYERGVSISRQWEQATTLAAVETANWVTERIWRLAKTKEKDKNRFKKVRTYCHRFVERAFGSPLTKEEQIFFVDQHFENDLSIYDQVKRVVILALKSPRFLYPSVQKRNKQFELASRSALILLDGVADRQLIELAKDNKLADQEVLHGELYRLLVDSRSKQKLKEFFHKWLKTEKGKDATKDQELYPKFNAQLMRDLELSLDLFLEDVVWSDASDYRKLFLSDYVWANPDIARFYALGEKEEDEKVESATNGDDRKPVGFQKIVLKSDRQAGLLTHPYLMTGLAYHNESSPVHRGVFVARSLLGRRLRQPPDDVEPLSEEFNPSMTTRERVEHQTKDTACMNCHSVINPLGFSLENFDAVGRFRMKEKDKPVNVAGVYTTPAGEAVQLKGPRDLAEFLARDETAQKNFIRQLFRHYAKQPIEAYGKDEIERLHKGFVHNGYNVRDLLFQIALTIVQHDL